MEVNRDKTKKLDSSSPPNSGDETHTEEDLNNGHTINMNHNPIENENIDSEKTNNQNQTDIVSECLNIIEEVVGIHDIDMTESNKDKPNNEPLIASNDISNNEPNIFGDKLDDKIETPNPLLLDKGHKINDSKLTENPADKSEQLNDVQIQSAMDLDDSEMVIDTSFPKNVKSNNTIENLSILTIDYLHVENQSDVESIENITGKKNGNDSESIALVDIPPDNHSNLEPVESVATHVNMNNNSNSIVVEEIFDSEAVYDAEKTDQSIEKLNNPIIPIDKIVSGNAENPPRECVIEKKIVQEIIHSEPSVNVEEPADNVEKFSQAEPSIAIASGFIGNVKTVNKENSSNSIVIQEIPDSESVDNTESTANKIEKLNNIPLLIPTDTKESGSVENPPSLCTVQINDVHEISDFESIDDVKESSDNVVKFSQKNTSIDIVSGAIESVETDVDMENNSNLLKVQTNRDSQSVGDSEISANKIEKLNNLPLLIPTDTKESGSGENPPSLCTVQINDVLEISDSEPSDDFEEQAHKSLKVNRFITNAASIDEILEISDSESIDGGKETANSTVKQIQIESVQTYKSMATNSNLPEVQEILSDVTLLSHKAAETIKNPACTKESIEIDTVHEISDSESIDGEEEPANSTIKQTQIETPPNLESIGSVQIPTSSATNPNLPDVPENLTDVTPLNHVTADTVKNPACTKESIEIDIVHEISDSESIDGEEEPANSTIKQIQIETPTNLESIGSVQTPTSSATNPNLPEVQENLPDVTLLNNVVAETVKNPACTKESIEIDTVHEISDSESIDGEEEPANSTIKQIQIETPTNLESIGSVQTHTSSATNSNSPDVPENLTDETPLNHKAAETVKNSAGAITKESIEKNMVHEISDSESIIDDEDNVLAPLRIEKSPHLGAVQRTDIEFQEISDSESLSNTKSIVKPHEIHVIIDSNSIDCVDLDEIALEGEIPQQVEHNPQNNSQPKRNNQLQNNVIETEDNAVSNYKNKTPQIQLDGNIFEISDDEENAEEVHSTPSNSSIINKISSTPKNPNFMKRSISNRQLNYRVYEQPSNDISNVKGLLGVEYVIKILKFSNDKKPTYYCCLCEVYNDALGMEAHLESIVHRLSYCTKYFPTAVRQCRQCVCNMESEISSKIMVLLLRKLCISIELYYGRQLPYTCYRNVYNLKSNEIIEKIYSSQHISETQGPAFAHIIDSVVIKDLIEQVENGIDILPANEPIFENTLNNKSSNRNLKPYINFNIPNAQHNSRLRNNLWRGTQQNARRNFPSITSQYTPAVNSYEKQVRGPSFIINNEEQMKGNPRSILKRPYQNPFSEHGKNIIKRPNLAQQNTEPKLIRQNSNPYCQALSEQSAAVTKNSQEIFIKDKYNKLLKEKAEEIDVLFQSYVMKPETHPLFREEWLSFWKLRKTELLNLGLDPHTYNYENDWKKHFEKRLMEFREKTWDKERLPILQKLNDELKTPTNESSQSKSQLTADISLLHVIRNLSKFEDLLGCFRDSVMTLMCQALRMEGNEQKNVNQLLNEENSITLKLLMHKFTDLLTTNMVEENRKPDLQLVVNGISNLLISME